jgi:protein-tyrosine phosphatase
VSAAIEIDSAGTGDYHLGELPDNRAILVGQAHGCEMTMRARQVSSEDFEKFDLIVAMDASNLSSLQRWNGAQPAKIRLARSFEPIASTRSVPDPYYGDIEDFEEVAAILEPICDEILRRLTAIDS